MARTINRLDPRTVKAAKKPGLYPDGQGLYLQVTSAHARSWLYRYSLDGRERGSARLPMYRFRKPASSPVQPESAGETALTR